MRLKKFLIFSFIIINFVSFNQSYSMEPDVFVQSTVNRASEALNNKYSKKSLIENYAKILTLLEPIVPHLANEAFKEIGVNKISWPNYDENLIIEDIITFVIQINGKKRGTLAVKINVSEVEILKMINQDEILKKYLNEKEIKKKIFIPNKLMNIII